MQVLSFELLRNLKVQQTLINEVDKMREKLEGEAILNDQTNEMKFLEMFVNETLRKWPKFRARN
jgi:cytochrome P450